MMVHSVRLMPVVFRLTLALPLLIGGCSTFPGHTQSNSDSKAGLKELQQLYFGSDVLLKYEALAPGSPERRDYRDRVINAAVLTIDGVYRDFVKQFSAFETGSNFALSPIVLGTGLRGSVDKKLYSKTTWSVLAKQMDAARLVQLVKIRSGLKRSDEQYPLTQGFVDLQNYYTAGTLPGALSRIAPPSGETNTHFNEQLRHPEGSYTYTDASATLRNYWKPGGTVNAAHAAAFDAWLSKNEPGVDIATFIYNPKYAAERAKAVAALIK